MDSPPLDPEKLSSSASESEKGPAGADVVAVNDLAFYPSAQDGETPDIVTVGFDDNPLEDPQRWSRAFRWYLTAVLTLINLFGNLATAAHTGLAAALSTHLAMSAELLTLSVSLFVCGSCLGTFLWGPLSEQYGRRAVWLCALLGLTASHVGSALSPTTASLEVFRFFAGVCIAPSACVNPGVLVDMWDAETREKTVVVTSISSYVGPAFGPLVGGAMLQAGIRWQWMFWLQAISSASFLLVMYLTFPETYTKQNGSAKRKGTTATAPRASSESNSLPGPGHPVALRAPAAASGYYAAQARSVSSWRDHSFSSAQFLCGCLYMFFEIYPIVFQQGYRFSPSAVGLTFLPSVIGELVGFVLYVYAIRRRYAAKEANQVRRLAGSPSEPSPGPEPESEPESPEAAHLTLAMWAAPIYAASYFWLGWTSFPSVSFWAPLASGFFVGLSAFWLTMALFNYVIVVYAPVIASALASATLMRGMFGTVLPVSTVHLQSPNRLPRLALPRPTPRGTQADRRPNQLFSNRMFDALSPRWASTIMGCVAVAMVPVPFVLRR
ncbi:major facilitator superfamily domain-containing protein [Trametes maxima]|nr:major facilitator superfamily domain-containing protein [Trametes maxima]